MIAYASDVDHDQHIALLRGQLEGSQPALVRVHSHCLTGDVLIPPLAIATNSSRGHWQPSRKKIAAFFLYLHHTGRGFGIEASSEPGVLPQIHVHARGQLDRSPARQRLVQHESGIGAQILIDSA